MMKLRLHKRQAEVFRDSARFKVIAAGRRFGKTVLACIVLFLEATRNKDGVYWLVAPTYGQAKELAWNILIRMIPKQMLAKKPNESELRFLLKNGAEIHLKGADNPDSLVGRGLRGIVIDEVARIRNHKRVWEEILRPSLSDYQGWAIFISTPQGKNYFWELWMKGQKDGNEYKSWRFKTEDNPFIPRSEIKAAQEQLNERYFRQEYEASFEDFTGLIWPEFNEKDHVIDAVEIPKHWESIGAIDPAVTGTTASLNAFIDEDGNLFIVNEYYEQNKRASEVASEIKGRSELWWADPAGKRKTLSRNGVLFSFFDEFLDYGIDLIPAQNDVASGINRTAEFFKSGKIKIFKNCKNLVKELLMYHWSEERESVNGVIEPKPYKHMDHLCDCLRYLVMSRFSPSESVKKKEVRFSEAYFERMEQQQSIYDEV